MNNIQKTLSFILTLILAVCSCCAFAEGEEWTCPECGAPNAANFCTNCGAEKPGEIVCLNCGQTYPADSNAVFCGNCGVKLQQDGTAVAVRYEGDGFATPEEALTCYMEGFKNLDFEQIMSAFAWETQMEHYDLQAYFERVMAYQSTICPRMPAVNDFMFSANVNALRFFQANMVYRSLEEYILGDDSPNKGKGIITFQKDSDDVEVFLKKFENGTLEKLAQMTNITFLSPDDVTNNLFSREQNQRNFMKQTACYGADEAVNLVGMAVVEDETFYCCPTICRYGDKWYLVSVSSITNMILGVPVQYQAFVCGKGSLEDLLQ